MTTPFALLDPQGYALRQMAEQAGTQLSPYVMCDFDASMRWICDAAGIPCPLPEVLNSPSAAILQVTRLISEGGGAASSFPDASTTGVQAGITLTNRGDWDINSSGTYENFNVSGYVFINANNVTLRNCHITAQPGQVGGVVIVATGKTGVIIEYCDIDGAAISGLKGVWLDVSVATIVRYCDIRACTDGVFMYGNDHYIHDNYIHDLDDVGPDPHMDCIQVGGNTGLVVEHNTLIGAADANSCFALGSNDGDLEITIDNNLMRPGPVMLCLINVGDSININETVYHVINNHMEPGHIGAGNPYLTYYNNLPTTWTGNVDADTGAAIPAPG